MNEIEDITIDPQSLKWKEGNTTKNFNPIFENYKLPELNQDKIEGLNSSITIATLNS